MKSKSHNQFWSIPALGDFVTANGILVGRTVLSSTDKVKIASPGLTALTLTEPSSLLTTSSTEGLLDSVFTALEGCNSPSNIQNFGRMVRACPSTKLAGKDKS